MFLFLQTTIQYFIFALTVQPHPTTYPGVWLGHSVRMQFKYPGTRLTEAMDLAGSPVKLLFPHNIFIIITSAAQFIPGITTIECSHFCGGIHFLLGHAYGGEIWQPPG